MPNLFTGGQKTIKEKIKLAGFTIDGSKTAVNLHPSDKGITFKKGRQRVNLSPEAISVRKNRVCIGPISMIEHLLAVLAGSGIDNVLIEVKGFELPIFDGSPEEYYDAVRSVGIYDLKRPRDFFRFKTDELDISNSHIESREDTTVEIEVEYDPGHPVIEKGRLNFSKIEDLTRARTFAFVERDDPRIEDYRFGFGVTNDGFYPGLRYPDEPIRHKLLDLIGDLYTIGRPFKGEIRAINPSHQLNTTFVRKQYRKS